MAIQTSKEYPNHELYIEVDDYQLLRQHFSVDVIAALVPKCDVNM